MSLLLKFLNFRFKVQSRIIRKRFELKFFKFDILFQREILHKTQCQTAWWIKLNAGPYKLYVGRPPFPMKIKNLLESNQGLYQDRFILQ